MLKCTRRNFLRLIFDLIRFHTFGQLSNTKILGFFVIKASCAAVKCRNDPPQAVVQLLYQRGDSTSKQRPRVCMEGLCLGQLLNTDTNWCTYGGGSQKCTPFKANLSIPWYNSTCDWCQVEALRKQHRLKKSLSHVSTHDLPTTKRKENLHKFEVNNLSGVLTLLNESK